MSSVIQSCRRFTLHIPRFYNNFCKTNYRTFLSNAYYCNEVWDSRLKSPIFGKIDLDDLYHELDLNYQKYKNISAVDVDIFANALQDDNHTDELIDLIHKLRLSAETSNMLESTTHSVIRNLMHHKHYDKLLQILDDRLNYGIFLDYYTANLLLDTFWKNKDYVSGAKTAAQLMLQEDFSHPMNLYLSLLHCYKYLVNKSEGWEIPPEPEEPVEEIKVRVNYIRNPYFDDHFDLKNPNHLVGKTLYLACSSNNDTLSRTLQLIGLELYEKHDKAKELIEKFSSNNEPVIKEALKLLPEDNEIRQLAEKLPNEDQDIEKILENKVKEAERVCYEKDISEICKAFEQWGKIRMEELTKQQDRYNIAQRITNIEEAKAKLQEKELKLWFFDREEQIELDIEGKKIFYPKRWFGKKKKPRIVDEGYIPPEVKAKYKREK